MTHAGAGQERNGKNATIQICPCKMLSFILNLPYTFVLLIAGLTCLPSSISFRAKPFAIVLKVKDFWWRFLIYKYSRAMASGNTILLGPKEEERDLEHELIHVRQFSKLPLIYPLFYYFEILKHGYRNNKYEDEAYRLSGSIYRGK